MNLSLQQTWLQKILPSLNDMSLGEPYDEISHVLTHQGHLYLTSLEAITAENLTSHKIAAVVSIGDFTESGITRRVGQLPHLYLSEIEDECCYADKLEKHIPSIIKFIHDFLSKGANVLVHCFAGISRSTTAVVAYLMALTGQSANVCLTVVRDVREFVEPNSGFRRMLNRLYFEEPLHEVDTCLRVGCEICSIIFCPLSLRQHYLFETCLCRLDEKAEQEDSEVITIEAEPPIVLISPLEEMD
jgi:predicted protein tyrosine phosphatase